MGHSFGLQPSSVAWSLRACSVVNTKAVEDFQINLILSNHFQNDEQGQLFLAISVKTCAKNTSNIKIIPTPPRRFLGKKCEKDLQSHNIEFSLLSSLGIFKFLEYAMLTNKKAMNLKENLIYF